MEKLFANETSTDNPFGIKMELRACFAEKLLNQYSVIAGTLGKEDSQGRATMILQDPKELVGRAFAIADAYFDMAEARGDIKAVELSPEEVHARRGTLMRIQSDAEWKRQETAKQTGEK